MTFLSSVLKLANSRVQRHSEPLREDVWTALVKGLWNVLVFDTNSNVLLVGVMAGKLNVVIRIYASS